ncbi:MAG: translation elongation factor Ts [Alphaproteobacteria bacterium]
MAQISASMVKELREMTNAGMMDCKKALAEVDGDMDAAVDWLRKKGLAAAAKKSGRVASEGLIGVNVDNNSGVLVEVNSETDFVSRNTEFQSFVANVSKVAVEAEGDVEKLKTTAYPESQKDVASQLTDLIAKIGENMSLRRTSVLKTDNGVVASYVHNQVSPNLGKIGVLVALESEAAKDKLLELGKQIAMHVAASNPQYLEIKDVDSEALDRERSVLSEQARASGKPENIIEKMVEGRLRKFYEEVVLLEQPFVLDPDNKVAKAVEQVAKEVGKPIKVKGFTRYALGEGIEKKENDFAAEVAAAAGK